MNQCLYQDSKDFSLVKKVLDKNLIVKHYSDTKRMVLDMEEKKRNYFDPMFCGTETMYKTDNFLFRGIADKIQYTESVRYFMREKKAYWIFDVMASYVPKLLKGKHEFVTFLFNVNEDNSCEFRAENGNGKLILSQEIPYTDMKESIKLFWTNNVLMFPSDY